METIYIHVKKLNYEKIKPRDVYTIRIVKRMIIIITKIEWNYCRPVDFSKTKPETVTAHVSQTLCFFWYIINLSRESRRRVLQLAVLDRNRSISRREVSENGILLELTVLPRAVIEVQCIAHRIVLEFPRFGPRRGLIEPANERLPFRAGDDLRPFPRLLQRLHSLAPQTPTVTLRLFLFRGWNSFPTVRFSRTVAREIPKATATAGGKCKFLWIVAWIVVFLGGIHGGWWRLQRHGRGNWLSKKRMRRGRLCPCKPWFSLSRIYLLRNVP